MKSPVRKGLSVILSTIGLLFFSMFATDISGAEVSSLLLDLWAGSSSSFPEYAIATDDLVYFTASSPTSGRELWRSDGTTAGTFLLKDIYPGYTEAPYLSYPDEFQLLGDRVIFRATDIAHGRELWVTDGTADGTVLLADIEPGSGSSDLGTMYLFGDLLYFVAGNATTGRELWRTDGTPAGTLLLADIREGSEWSSPKDFVEVGNYLVFLAADNDHGRELWGTDGTATGTKLLVDAWSGSQSSLAETLCVYGGVLYFEAYATGSSKKELWCTNGTPSGTRVLRDAKTGLQATDIEMGPAMGSIQFFAATDSSHGRELWRTDGTAAGTFMIYDLYTGTGWSSPEDFQVVGPTLYFTGKDGSQGRGLCFTNGTWGNLTYCNLNPSSTGAAPEILETLGSVVLFETYSSSSPSQKTLWRTDGTAAGTYALVDASSGRPCEPTGSGCLLSDSTWIFVADSTFWGRELWRTDGTAAGTYLLKDILSGTSWSSPSELRLIQDHVIFLTVDGGTGHQLWTTDGTSAGTRQLTGVQAICYDFTQSDAAPSYPCFFQATPSQVGQPILAVTTGVPAGTTWLTDANTGRYALHPIFLRTVNALHYFAATDSAGNRELWRSDGTLEGTLVLAANAPGEPWGEPESMTVMGGLVVFTAATATTGREPWVTDGTLKGTGMLADIATGTGSSYATDFTYMSVSALTYFRANAGDGMALWQTDGTPAGTQRATASVDRGGTSRSAGEDVACLGATSGGVFLRGYSPSAGYEIWFAKLPDPPDPNSVSDRSGGTCINTGVGQGSVSGTLTATETGRSDTQFVLLAPPSEGTLTLNASTGQFTYVLPASGEFSGEFYYKVISGGEQTLPIRVPVLVGNQTISLSVAPGWNMLSVPFDLDLTPEMIFTQAGDVIFDGSPWYWSLDLDAYTEVTDSFLAGDGFWLFSHLSQTVTVDLYGLSSSAVTHADTDSDGWRLMGMPVSTPVTDIAGAIEPAWEYTGGQYVAVDTLLPGHACWVLILKSSER